MYLCLVSKNLWYTNNKNVTSESIQHMKIHFLRSLKCNECCEGQSYSLKHKSSPVSETELQWTESDLHNSRTVGEADSLDTSHAVLC